MTKYFIIRIAVAESVIPWVVGKNENILVTLARSLSHGQREMARQVMLSFTGEREAKAKAADIRV